jgi:hypothetical protein
MMTGERAESDYMLESSRELAEIKAQLDEIVEQVRSIFDFANNSSNHLPPTVQVEKPTF